MPDVRAWTRLATERLTGDESLRGDLSDEGFLPLLNWALETLQTYAAHALDAASVDRYGETLKRVVETAVTAAMVRKLDAPRLLAYLPEGQRGVPEPLAKIQLSDDPDANAVALASALRAIPQPVPTPIPRPQPVISAPPPKPSRSKRPRPK